MRLYEAVRPGDRIDGALVVWGKDWRKVVLRVSKHYAVAVRIVPAGSDLRRHSWLAQWLRLQVRLLWFPVDCPVVYQQEMPWILDQIDYNPRKYELVPSYDIDGWYVRRIPWWRDESGSALVGAQKGPEVTAIVGPGGSLAALDHQPAAERIGGRPAGGWGPLCVLLPTRDIQRTDHGGPARAAEGPADECRCEQCGSSMEERHCKLVCPGCGYTRDCSDP